MDKSLVDGEVFGLERVFGYEVFGFEGGATVFGCALFAPCLRPAALWPNFKI